MNFLIYTIVAILFILLILLYKKKNKAIEKKPIPGVSEMAKTIVFWSEYHRNKNKP